jgi:AcrR family transcriptional regulator
MTTPNEHRRSQRSRRAILDAALDLCAEQGYGNVTVEGIAARAGASKKTIYRWWASKAAVIQEALNERIGQRTDFPDTGDLRADLRTQMSRVAAFLASAEVAPYTGLISAAQDDPDVARSVVENLIEPRERDCRKRLESAREQRQIRPELDLDDVIEMLYAPLYYRLLVRTRPITTQQVDAVLELAFTGLAPRPDQDDAAQARKS